MRRGDVLTLKIQVVSSSHTIDGCESAIRRVSIENVIVVSAEEILRGSRINAITVS